MTNPILHYAQTALLTSIAALSLALIIVDALVLNYIETRNQVTNHYLWLLKSSVDGGAVRYLARLRDSKDRPYIALMVVGGVDLFVSCTALAIQYGLKRVNVQVLTPPGKVSTRISILISENKADGV